MVCNRCIKTIQSDVETLGIHLKHIELGSIIYEEKSIDDFENIKNVLENNGFEILLAQDQQLVCLLYTSPSPRDRQKSRMPSSA